MSTGTLIAGLLPKIGRTELAQIPVPEATSTHIPSVVWLGTPAFGL